MMMTNEHEQLLYDVYLCFRGIDTRHGFTGSLFNALRDNRFKTFMDEDGLKRGNHISASLSEAMESSRIAIVVLSENFANSSFCLDELVEILESQKRFNQRVLPIFYNVDPCDVRNQRGRYGNSIYSHETRLQNSDRLPKWKSALYQVSCLSGFCFKNGYQGGCEYELIEEIVNWVSSIFPRYDVFLSFREQDTRYSFSGYLYNALNQEGFKVFMKEEDQQLSQSEIVTTLEKSRLSIIVLSADYAYSSSCLDELVTILEFVKKNKQLLVWPIFYKVEPTDMRKQKNSYEKAMTEHENKFGQDSEKVKTWRSALFEVANLKGWHLKFGYEYELIEKIVQTALKI